MDLPKNRKTNKNFNCKQQTDNEFPKVVTAQWHWKGYAWSAYQLPNGVKIMSARQVSRIVGFSEVHARKFLEQNQLEGIFVEIPNRKIIKCYTLLSVAIYLRRLLDEDNLQCHPLSLSHKEWKELIEALLNPERVKAITPNPRFFIGKYRVTKAKAIEIQLSSHINLEVLVLPSGECRIGYVEAMNCIHAKPEWIIENSPKRAKILSKLNISTQVMECRVATSEGTKKVYALDWDDWLSVWEYLANRGNTKATAVLKACAKESIPVRVSKVLSDGQ